MLGMVSGINAISSWQPGKLAAYLELARSRVGDLWMDLIGSKGGAQALQSRRIASALLMAFGVLVGSACMFASPGESAGAAEGVSAVIQTRAAVQPVPPRAAETRRAPSWVAEHLSRSFEARPPLAAAAATYPLQMSDAVPLEAQPAAAPPAREVEGPEDFTGIWAVNTKACTPTVGREGFLPTIINAQGAWAGETTCAFKAGHRDGNTWIFPAVCSDANKLWKSEVRLSVKGKQLTWKSQSGSRTYVRCEQWPAREQVALSTVR